MAIGIDVGTMNILAAREKEGKVEITMERDAFFDIELADFVENLLTKSGVNYVKDGNKLYVIGDKGMKFSNIFHRECRRPMKHGMLSPQEKKAFPIIKLIISAVVGEPREENEKAIVSVPANPLDRDADVGYHQNVLIEILKSLGYNPSTIVEGLAIIYSELADTGFSGIGMSFGGGMVNVCLGYLSVPIFSFSFARSGDWIDHQVAQAVGETDSRVCAIKEKELDLTKEQSGDILKGLHVYYETLVKYTVENLKNELSKVERLPQFDDPLPVVVSGGTSLPQGFTGLVAKELEDFPIPLGEIKRASEPLYAVAKGALVACKATQ